MQVQNRQYGAGAFGDDDLIVEATAAEGGFAR
jgi:hypothetical protein